MEEPIRIDIQGRKPGSIFTHNGKRYLVVRTGSGVLKCDYCGRYHIYLKHEPNFCEYCGGRTHRNGVWE